MFQILTVQSWLLVTTKLSFSLEGIKMSRVRKQNGVASLSQKETPSPPYRHPLALHCSAGM